MQQPSVRVVLLPGVLTVLAAVHLAFHQPGEPHYNGDETRHVMTGVCVRDLLVERPPLSDLKGWTVRYYLQYPALGLLVWPPLFYLAEGVWMLLFGTSFLAARLLIGLFAAIACGYLFALVRRSHGDATAAVAVLTFGLSPLVFELSQHVMLEVPTLAFVLAALYHMDRYLESDRGFDLVLGTLATAAAPLTRIDGIVLLPLFVLLLFGRQKLSVLLRWQVLLAVAVAIGMVLPYYLFAARQVGGAQLLAATQGTNATSTGFLAPQNFIYYPRSVPGQIGWFATPFAIVGLLASLAPMRRLIAWPYLALVAATYFTFTPLAEVESRHAIYWVPALAVFAAEGCRLVAAGQRDPVTRVAIRVVMVLGTGMLAVLQPLKYVRGYEMAAEYVVTHTRDSDRVLFDSYLGGNFIYQVRRHDPDRKLSVLRGDKLLYAMLSDPHAAYKENAATPQEILDILYRFDPEFIVVESPQIYFKMRIPDLLLEVLEANPERFQLEQSIPIESNHREFRNRQLLLYRNLKRNPTPERGLELEVLGLGRTIGSGRP